MQWYEVILPTQRRVKLKKSESSDCASLSCGRSLEGLKENYRELLYTVNKDFLETMTMFSVRGEHVWGMVYDPGAGGGVVGALDSQRAVERAKLSNLFFGVVNDLLDGRSVHGRARTRGALRSAPRPTPADAPNANQAWADLIVGELVRGGVGVFCVAPGSRSTPLTLAAERHPTARVVVCIDERSLGFYALGYGKGSGKAAAVITSSGTAVANLLPAAVEAHESCAPLLLLTADRPPELRDTGANQTIDQVKIFGSYARFGVDLAPPGDGSPARVAATAVATAVRHLHGPRPGPVHVNCQFRDPLGPSGAEWDARRDLRGLDGWERGSAPFTAGAPHASSSKTRRRPAPPRAPRAPPRRLHPARPRC